MSLNAKPPNPLIEIARILLEFEIERIAAAADEPLARDAAATAHENQSTVADRSTDFTSSRPTGQAGGGDG